jgi:4-hydroxyacetophenone monooxygenase
MTPADTPVDKPEHDVSDAQMAAAVADANVPTLLMLLVQLTGDVHWLEAPYTLGPTRGMSDNDSGGLDDQLQDEIRTAALDAILAWRSGAPVAIPEPSDELVVKLLSRSMAEEVPLQYGPMLATELTGASRGALPDSAPWQVPNEFSVLVVGAGVSGILAGIRLSQAGIPYRILEKHASVGGVWLENQYPGCSVDTPSSLYSYSFARNDWTHDFAKREEVKRYLETVASDYGILPSISFDTEVRSAEYSVDRQGWVVRTEKNGVEELLYANVLVSAVGAFNTPITPNIAGIDTFKGQKFHTARWPDDANIVGRRVAVIGNGASAMQVVPAIADEVASLTIFQRTAQWAQPFEKFGRPTPDAVRLLMREVPLYDAWHRVRLDWIFHDRLYPALQVDREWDHPERSVNAINDGHRRFLTRYIASELDGRDDLIESVLPTYPPFGKRMLFDNGWFRALKKPAVRLVNDAITQITEHSVVTARGEDYEVDVIVLATGFDVARFLSTLNVTGRSGSTLRQVWDDDDCRAYLGTAIPGFPNLFCLYGPNTQAGHGGSFFFTVEAQVDYLMSMLRQMFDRGLAVVECRQEVFDEYNKSVDETHARMIWTHSGVHNYSRTPKDESSLIALSEMWTIGAERDMPTSAIMRLIAPSPHWKRSRCYDGSTPVSQGRGRLVRLDARQVVDQDGADQVRGRRRQPVALADDLFEAVGAGHIAGGQQGGLAAQVTVPVAPYIQGRHRHRTDSVPGAER